MARYEEKTKKPVYKKWWFWLIIIVVLIAIIGGTQGNKQLNYKRRSKSR